MKVLVSDKFSPEGLKVFQDAKGIDLEYHPGMSEEELLSAVADADALVVRGGTQVNQKVLQAAKKLKVVGRAGVGVENMDMAEANAKGVVIMNTPYGSTTTMAEYTIAMLLTMARQIPLACAATKAGAWTSNRFVGIDVTGRTLGVIGAGKIGRLVIERALALNMRVVVYDPYLAEDVVQQMGADFADFFEVLAQSDFLTLHVPLNMETEEMLGEEALARIKPGCRIINCALGGLVDENALIRALQDGRVAGAALDVFSKEPPDRDNPLLAMDQVICTPHLRAETSDAQTNVTVQTAHQVVDFLQKGIVVNALNVPSINANLLRTLKPYLELAERLGLFQAQIFGRGLQTVTIEYSGTVTDYPIEHLTMALLKGLLTPMIGPLVNFVNAAHRAREQGIRLVEAKSSTAEGFSNMIRLTVSSADGERSVCGAVFGPGDYRIVRVDGYQVEAIPDGHILVLHNDDRPGVIGYLGQLLSDGGVNIAMMNLSRRKIQGRAISLVNVDSRISDKLIEELRSNAHILSAVQVKV